MTPPKPQENTQQSNGANGDEPRFVAGNPITWFARQPINHDSTLLDLRFLCRGGGMLIVAPSGQGKSTLSIQIAILWSCGKPAFGITTGRARRILIVQSEDDQGDCTEMSEMVHHLGLTPEQITEVEKNTELVRCNNLSGAKFIAALALRLQEAKDDGHPFDLVIINPYSTYLGDDVLDAKANSDFLIHKLNPVLSRFGVAIVIIHHTPKTNWAKDFNKLNDWDFQYAGAGSAQMVNWARAMLVIVPQPHNSRVFMFVAAKRGKRLELWNDSITRYFKHSEPGEVLRWIDATAQECSAAQDAKKKKQGIAQNFAKVDEIIQKCVSLTDWRSEVRVYEIGQKVFGFGNCGRKKVHDALKQGVLDDSVNDRQTKRSTGKDLPEYIRLK